MSDKIIRTPDKALGGITREEQERLDQHTNEWIKVAYRTEPIDPEKIIPAIEGIYKSAGLDAPRVVIASSPVVMAAAYGAACAMWHNVSATYRATDSATYSATHSATDSATRSATHSATYSATHSATDSATRSATHSATYSATHSATDSATRSATDSATVSATYRATDSATYSATRNATYSATDSATYSATDSATRSATYSATDSASHSAMAACFDMAGEFGVECAKRWYMSYHGGNMWAPLESYLTAFRDILGLRLSSHAAYAHWETAAREGGFRVLHPKFCIVSDFPEYIKVDEQNEPHCETGPSHRWRDGWSLYHWHGVRVPGHWIETPEEVSPDEILGTENVEQRAAGISIVGMAKMLDRLQHKIIDSDEDPSHGDLIEVKLADLPEPGLYLKAECPRNGTIMEAVPNHIATVKGAQAWRVGLTEAEFQYPAVRT